MRFAVETELTAFGEEMIEVIGKTGEGAGFALFHGSDGSDYWMAMKREKGEWKVLSLAPQLFGGAVRRPHRAEH